MKTQTKQSGFTLVELAIVLVIIGLIVGGVLAGQDLIKAAKLQKGVKQLTDTNTGAATFLTKYGQIPGDYSNANSFTTGAVLSNGNPAQAGLGNGDGAITGYMTTPAPVTAFLSATGETLVFFPELFNNGYISETMLSTSLTLAPSIVEASSGRFLSFATGSVVNKPLVAVQSFGGAAYISVVGAPSAAVTAATGATPWTQALAPAQAQGIDAKQDDGVPNTGSIRAITPTGVVVPGTADTTVGTNVGSALCVSLVGTTYSYNGGLQDQLCNISVRASF